ncbi:MAG: hypothetical protein R2867_39235 [Caldilineaceae bacterium]
MWPFIIGLFFVLHGLVHLLYLGQSWRFFELQPGMSWPDGSWVFAPFTGVQATRAGAAIGCILAAVGFVAGGIGLIAGWGWWQPIIIGTAALSALLYLLFWDGTTQRLDNQGGIGLLINVAIGVAVLNW